MSDSSEDNRNAELNNNLNIYQNNYHANLQMSLNSNISALSDHAHYLNGINLGLQNNYSLLQSKSDKIRRNVWTEKKNAALVEIVKKSPHPTPWRPKHGTNKEVWTDIAKQINSMPEIFDFPILWEAAKEQLLKLIDRQKMRRSIGDFEANTPTEKYLDDMIRHMDAEDREKERNLIRRNERLNHRKLIEEGKEVPKLSRKRKRTSLKGLSIEELMEISKATLHENSIDDDFNDISRINEEYKSEMERIENEYQEEKERLRIIVEKDRDNLLIQRDHLFLKFVQEQEIANQTLTKSTQYLMKLLQTNNNV